MLGKNTYFVLNTYFLIIVSNAQKLTLLETDIFQSGDYRKVETEHDES
jgi:hypothetical protein